MNENRWLMIGCPGDSLHDVVAKSKWPTSVLAGKFLDSFRLAGHGRYYRVIYQKGGGEVDFGMSFFVILRARAAHLTGFTFSPQKEALAQKNVWGHGYSLTANLDGLGWKRVPLSGKNSAPLEELELRSTGGRLKNSDFQIVFAKWISSGGDSVAASIRQFERRWYIEIDISLDFEYENFLIKKEAEVRRTVGLELYEPVVINGHVSIDRYMALFRCAGDILK